MDAQLEYLIRALEERLLQSHTRQDAEALEQLLAEGFIEFGARGVVWNRSEVIQGLLEQAFVQRTLEDFRVRLLAEDVVLATYVCATPGADGTVRSLRSSVWRRQQGAWRMEFHQGTRIPD